MKISARKWSACGVLALGVLVCVARAEEDAEKVKVAADAQKGVLEVAEGKGDPKTVYQKNGLEPVMWGFKLKDKHGIGAGNVGGPGKNGIEAKIIALAKQQLAPDVLMKDAAGLTKMAQITKAIGDISANHKVMPAAGKTQKDWDKYNKDMIDSSDNLIKAIKANNPMSVKTAFGKLNQSCNECHGKFRDD